jgi:hypothetical protein
MFRYVQLMINITSYYTLSSGAAKIHFFCTVGLMSKTRPLAAVNAAIAQANAQVGSLAHLEKSAPALRTCRTARIMLDVVRRNLETIGHISYSFITSRVCVS